MQLKLVKDALSSERREIEGERTHPAFHLRDGVHTRTRETPTATDLFSVDTEEEDVASEERVSLHWHKCDGDALVRMFSEPKHDILLTNTGGW